MRKDQRDTVLQLFEITSAILNGCLLMEENKSLKITAKSSIYSH